MAVTFTVDDEDEKKVKKWFIEHECHEPSKQAKLRTLVYSFCANGLGLVTKVKCTGCNRELNLTDVSTW